MVCSFAPFSAGTVVRRVRVAQTGRVYDVGVKLNGRSTLLE